MENGITGHFKKLTADEWLEGCHAFIKDARGLVRRSKLSGFGRDYYLAQAREKLELAEQCLKHAICD